MENEGEERRGRKGEGKNEMGTKRRKEEGKAAGREQEWHREDRGQRG